MKEDKVVNKMIVRGKEDNYFGIERTFCLGRLDIGEMLDLPEGAERWGRREPGVKVIDYDFGKPCPNDSNFKTNQSHTNRWDFEDAMKDTIDKVMLSGTREDIATAVRKQLCEDYTMSILYTAYSKAGGYMSRIEVKVEKKGEEKFKDDEITTDLKSIKPYLSDQEYNVRAEIDQPDYRTSSKTYNGNAALDYVLKKMLKEKYTYCVKNGKNIVPDEYIKNGESGIMAFKNEKRSKNKNNSIEKQMVRKLKKEKISTAMESLYDVMRVMLGEGKDPIDYTQLLLSVDGRWNTGRKLNTVKKQILNMTDNELVMLSDEEIKTRCKNFWKVALNRAIRRIDEDM